MNELTSSSPRPTYDLDALRQGARSVRHPLTRALLVLTFTTGLVDAVSYLGLGRVFTANMTGNVVLLGFGIAGSGGLPVLAPLISLVAFLVGAAPGGSFGNGCSSAIPSTSARALRSRSPDRCCGGRRGGGRPSPENVLGGVCDLAWRSRWASATRRFGRSGSRAHNDRVDRHADRACGRPPLTGGTGRGLTRRGVTVLAMLIGAIAGALLVKTSLVLPLVAAAALALINWVV